ncbi:MAG: hypothetical protein CBARDCOR_0513 [uncultured Caballeronia sp.]|nr:MAG: hypothetical protein CBARDCOR_0513 [uncultured Caballeronia sp.]
MRETLGENAILGALREALMKQVNRTRGPPRKPNGVAFSRARGRCKGGALAANTKAVRLEAVSGREFSRRSGSQR